MDKLDLIALCHDQAHLADHNFEDALFCTLTRRDIWILCLSVLILGATLPCLEDESAEILERIAELADVQKTHWRNK